MANNKVKKLFTVLKDEVSLRINLMKNTIIILISSIAISSVFAQNNLQNNSNFIKNSQKEIHRHKEPIERSKENKEQFKKDEENYRKLLKSKNLNSDSFVQENYKELPSK